MASVRRSALLVCAVVVLSGAAVACGTAATPPQSTTNEIAAPPPPPVTQTLAPADLTLAGLNYFHTDGATIRDVQGNVVQLTGVNWFGMETDTLAPHGLWIRNWREMLDQIAGMGFNVIRLPFSNEIFSSGLTPQGIDFSLNPDLKGLNGLEIMDRIVTGAGERGMKVILDQHRATTDGQSPLWYTRELSEDRWIDHWRALAERYRGNDTVVGVDLHNEPAGDATWGDGNPKTDWRLAAERAGNAVLEINPSLLVFVEGVEKIQDDFGNVLNWYWMGGSLQYVQFAPVRLQVPGRLVYSPHDYGPGVYPQGWFQAPDFPYNLPAVWDHHWGFIPQDQATPLFLGEFGGRSVGDDVEGVWQRRLVGFLKERGIGYAYWSLNSNSGDTGGLLLDDWRSVDQAKLELLKTYQGAPLPSKDPTRINRVALPPGPDVAPLKVWHQDQGGASWTVALTPELHVANKSMQPAGIGGIELRYWFTADGATLRYGPASQVVTVERVFVFADGQPQDLSLLSAHATIERDASDAAAIDPRYVVRVAFAPGVTVPPRASVGVRLDIRKRDGSAYHQANDYSYREYHWPTEWDRVGLYRAGKLVWGTDPLQYQAMAATKEAERELARERRFTEKATNFVGS